MSNRFLYSFAIFAWIPILLSLIYQNTSPLGNSIKFRHDLVSDQKWAEKMIGAKEKPVVLNKEASGFLLKVPEGYNTLNITVKFKNNSNEIFKITAMTNDGTLRKNYRSFDYKPLNNFPWRFIKEGDITLYQKYKKYDTLQEFYNAPPTGSVIAFYEFSDLGKINRKPTVLRDYEPSEEMQFIQHTLRGSHTIYTYIKNEDLYFEFEKQDINRVEGEDSLIIDVSNAESLFTKTIPDDGIVDDSGKIENVQKVKIEIPNLPEGVYKITLKQPGGDALIKNIKTRQHKLVFGQKIYPADSALYEGISPKPATVYSGGARLTAITRDEFSTQQLVINNEATLNIEEAGETYSVDLPLGMHEIFTPASNVQLTDNYFAFSKEAYFEPFDPSFYPYNAEMSLDSFDYLITSYVPPTKDDDWLVNSQTFDVSRIEKPDRLVPISLIVPKIYEARTDEERVVIDHLDIEMIKSAPKDPSLTHKVMAFFPKLIRAASAKAPEKEIKRVLSLILQSPVKAAAQ